jgi:hypothetical protein
MDKKKIRRILFIVFIVAFSATIAMTLWSYGLHAGLFGSQPEKEDKYLGWMLAAVILELVAAVVVLWTDVFGLRGDVKSPEIGALKKRIAKIEDSISDLSRVHIPRTEKIQCSLGGKPLTEIDAAIPGTRDIACPACLGKTRVQVGEDGKVSTSQLPLF